MTCFSIDNCWRENKNRYVFSLLAALIELNVFEEISCNFLLVGHTGNEVDQLFSILATELKADLRTIEDLKVKIENSPIKPKPIYKELSYIFGWKNFVRDHLTEPSLVNHTFYNSFLIKKESGVVKFRAKRLPQYRDTELVPRAGIRLLKENTEFYPVGPAEFRTDSIPFDRIMKTISTLTARMPLLEKMNVQESWDKLRENLESVPAMTTLRKMKLSELPKQVEKVPADIPDYLLEADDDNAISGALCDEDVSEGSLEEIREDVDICVYTEATKGRPWVGRVKEMLPGGKFVIHWFERKSGRGNRFTALSNPNGTPHLETLELSTIMFWAFTENRRQDSFIISPYWMEHLRLEYEKLDLNE